MNKMTAQEILAAIEAADISVDEFAYGDFESPEGVGEYDEVDEYGGEDCGSEWYSVKFFKDHNVYIRTDGYYQSYDGATFDDYGQEVFPTEVTKIEYLPKQK